LATTGVIGVLDVIDASRIEGYLANMERLSGFRLFVVSTSGRLISAAEAPALPLSQELEILTIATRLYRESLNDWPEPGPLAASLIRAQGVEVGAAVALGEGSGARVPAEAAHAICHFVEGIVSSEHDLESLTREVVERYEEVNLLYDLSTALSGVIDVTEIARIAADRGACATRARTGAVFLNEGGVGKLALIAAVGEDADRLFGARIPSSDPFVRAVYASTDGVIVESAEEFPFSVVAGRSGGTTPLIEPPLLAVPLGSADSDRGLLIVTGPGFDDMFGAGQSKILYSVASQTAIAIQNTKLIEAARVSERINREMEIAESIQAGLLPDSPPPTTGLEIAGRTIHPAMVGGDYYDYIPAAPDCVTFAMADVTGHGFGSALVMAIARSVIRGELAKGSGPAEALATAARILYPDLTKADILITIFLARWEGAHDRLTFANAGHNPAFHWRASSQRVEKLDANGLIVGVLDEQQYDETQVPFQMGDVLLLYTDGLVEARGASGEFYGEDRLAACLAQNSGRPAGEILEACLASVREFLGDRVPHDDISVVVARATV